MPLLFTTSWIFIFLIFLIFITQIIIPVLRETSIFPVFRKEGKLVNKLFGVNQIGIEKNLEKTIKEKME